MTGMTSGAYHREPCGSERGSVRVCAAVQWDADVELRAAAVD